MSQSILKTKDDQELILLLYSETVPYTTVTPPGITVDMLSKKCKELCIELCWRKKYWNKNFLHLNNILVYIGNKNRSVSYITKGLRNAFAHCLLQKHDKYIYGKCQGKDMNSQYKGNKVFEMLIEENKLIELLIFIKENKR